MDSVIGRPAPDKQIYLLDSYLQPVPIGVTGEIYSAGRLARGYLNQPDQTAERFICNPFASDPGDRLYRTGDLARYLPDGTIEFQGRTDHQVAVRGFRIELGEVEAVLNQHPAVRESVIVNFEFAPADKRLLAYVVTASGSGATIAGLRAFLRSKLPPYMLPSVFVLLDGLPRLSNGKINRRALPTPVAAHLESLEVYTPPRTPVEERLTKIWSEVLGLNCIGIYDDFFELGGDSLLATKIMSRISFAFGLQIPLRILFDAPTIAELSAAIAKRKAEIDLSSS